ncbi:hypothetical protein [Lysinibacillus xylanilyticus]|uniref:hypothetical protein n=1 Tax=Lysinibacillus xylanilyticus TaxID=582475 RepID=UPI003CFE5AD0
MDKAMTVVYSSENLSGEIPENILRNVKNVYSHFTVRSFDGTTVLEVPPDEVLTVENFYGASQELLKKIQQRNHVLAIKLAHNHGFKLLK